MKLAAIFEKDISRPIEGVIKADDRSSIATEVGEYVLTNEVAKRLEGFLSAYNAAKAPNGVWVSGFFGSGKSHLLKILSFVLDRDTSKLAIDGQNLSDLFLSKCGDNVILRSDLHNALAVPARSILFNIDQKADVISKKDIDALLAVFAKVFDESCGYYGKQGYIAQFERDLAGRGQLDAFCEAYQAHANKPWERGREEAILEGPNIAKAYAHVVGGDAADAKGILDKYRSQYKLSIEDFADRVMAYIQAQPEPNFRLNFFVDEVGQYVADNTKLMTNLQTLAESLSTRCEGRAWILVTAQEDMATVVGQMEKQQGNDFSKIQARFATRLKLTSTNVDEVIQKRLLLKNEAGVALLEGMYQDQAQNLKSMFHFGDGSQSLPHIKDRDHFIFCYPFHPYQFQLFQTCIQSLSEHNAFEGRHSSVGERSMLGVFQQVMSELSKRPTCEVGSLAPFDLMFEGIRTALKSGIQNSVMNAEKNLGSHPLAVRALKALFLVKYVRGFRASVRNLAILLIESIECRLDVFEGEVEASLALLVRETLIQRVGDTYEFLTNEEKDVETEIKNTDVDNDAVMKETSKLFFEDVLKTSSRMRVPDLGRDFTFSRKLDDQLFGRDEELAIHVATPWNSNADHVEILGSQNMGRDELLVVLPQDSRWMQDLKLFLQTDKYIRLNTNNAQSEIVARILGDKRSRQVERAKELQTSLASAVAKARLFVSGTEIEIGPGEPMGRIQKAFGELVQRVHPNLKMLKGVIYNEGSVRQALASVDDLVAGAGGITGEAELEVQNFLRLQEARSAHATIKGVVDKFSLKPYGWGAYATLAMLARLQAAGRIEVRLDATVLDNDRFLATVLVTGQHERLVVGLREQASPAQLRTLKDFYHDFFAKSDAAGEVRALLGQITGCLRDLNKDLGKMLSLEREYPFLSGLRDQVALLAAMESWPEAQWLRELGKVSDFLLNWREARLLALQGFFKGGLRAEYDAARVFADKQRPNFPLLEASLVSAFQAALEVEDIFRPARIQALGAQFQALRDELGSKLLGMRGEALAKLCDLRERMENHPSYERLGEHSRQNLQAPFDRIRQAIESESYLANIREALRRFEELEYGQLLAGIDELAKPPETPKATTGAAKANPSGESEASRPKPEPVVTVPLRTLRVAYAKPLLASEADVEDYLDVLKDALMVEVRAGKRVQI